MITLPSPRNNHFTLKAISAAAALLLASVTVRAQSPADDLIQKGDVCDKTFHPAEALQYYLPAQKLDPQNVRIVVNIARQYRHLMTDATSRDQKLQLGAVALEYSRRSAALAPNDSEAQLALAITYGKMLPLQGSKEQVEASARIKDSAERALKLDPRNDTAWYILGRWHRAIAEVGSFKRTMGSLIYGKLPTSTNEAAVACFQKAIAINPTRLMHQVELGRTYAAMGKTDEARRFITKGLAMASVEKDDPETKRLGRETLAKLR
jgi:tetratricopeptide (TPR) repeat protein